MTAADMEAKFEACVRGVLADDQVRPTIAGFRALDSIPDVRPLFSSLGTTTAQPELAWTS